MLASGRARWATLVVLGLAACDQATTPTPGAESPAGRPQLIISDAAHGGTEGFYFLPPLVPDPGPFSGTFDATLSPVVKICRFIGGTCQGSDIVFNGGTGAQRVTVNEEGESYSAIWRATSGVTVGHEYRLRVYRDAAGIELAGTADLRVVAKTKDQKTLPAGFIGVVRGAPLQIKFRFETTVLSDEAPFVSSTTPDHNAADVAVNANLDITFSEAVDLTGDWFSIVCGSTGTRGPGEATVTGGPISFTIDPTTDFAGGESCTATIVAAQVTDQDADDPPDVMASDRVASFMVVTAGSEVAPTAKNDAFTMNAGATLNGSLYSDNGSGADGLGTPTAGVSHFGGGSLGGTVTDHQAGTSTALAGGTLTVNTDGSFSLAALTDGVFTLDYRLTNSAGTSDARVTITVNAAPVAPVPVDDGPTANSAPGDAYHAGFNTLFALPAAGVLSNDALGSPAGAVSHFGGGSLGGAVGDHPPGTPVNFGSGGSLTVSADGSVSFSPSTGFTGLFTFQYRVTNGSGSGDATVTIAVGARPTAVNDTYAPTLVGNVPVNTATSTGFTVLANDGGNGLTAALVSATNGTATVNANGTFTFTPTIGFSGAASIIYKTTNGFGDSPSNGTVSLTVGTPAWFVNSAAAPGGDGRPATPFTCLVGASGCFNGSANLAGHIIYLATGTYQGTGALVLKNSQRLIGQGASGAFGSLAGLTWPADAGAQPATGGTHPTISSASGNGITLASGNTLRGLVAGNAPGVAIAGATVGTLTIGDASISNTSGRALDLTTSGTLAVALTSIAATGGIGNGINLVSQSGSLTSGTTTITNPSGTGIHIQSSAGFSLGNTTVTKSSTAGTGVSLQANSGTTAFTALNITTSSGTALDAAAAGTVSVGGGTLSATGGPAINVTSTTFAGTGFTSTSSSSSTSRGINLTSISGTLALGSGSVTGATTGGFSANGGAASISYSGSISNNLSNAIQVIGKTGGAVTLSGNITETGSGLSIVNNTGGIVTLSGTTISLTTGANTAVSAGNNAGATIDFTGGGLAITTTTGTGFNATGGGTVTVQAGANPNTIASGAATALTVQNTTIGSGGLTFRSVTSSGGTVPGIALRSTGTAGGLTVTGNGTPGSGGTIASKTGANAWAFVSGFPTLTGSSGVGVLLENTLDVSLSWMQLNDFSNAAIAGFNASNVSLINSIVSGASGASGDDIAQDEAAVFFFNLTGTGAITNASISGGMEENLAVLNASGTLDRLVISGSTFGFNNTINGNSSIKIASHNPGTTVKFTLKSSTIKGARADWISAVANAGSTMDAVIGGPLVADGNGFDNLGANAHPGAAAGSNRLVVTSVGTQTVDIRNNTLKGAMGEAMLVRATAVGALTGTLNARVRNNTVGVAATANSGSAGGTGIFLTGDGGSDINAAITDNSVFQYNNHGIRMDFGDEINDGSVFHVTVTGNTVGAPGSTFTDFNAIHLNNGTVSATDNFATCVDIGGSTAALRNAIAGGGKGATPPNNADLRLRQRQSTTVRLPGYGGANSDDAAVVAYLTGRNTLTTAAASNTVATAGGGFVNTNAGTACTQPTVPE